MHWLLLIFAIALEICGTTCMKLSQGFTRPWPSILVFVFYGLCFSALTLALKRIDLSVAYAVWSGLGTVLVVGIGVLYFNEPFTAARALFLGLVIVGVVGLKLTSGT